MKKLLPILFILGSFYTFSQTLAPIDVTTQALTIPGTFTVATWENNNKKTYTDFPVLQYGFAEGDEIILKFSMDSKKGTNQIEIKEYESNAIIYSNKDFVSIDDLILKIPKTSVYTLVFKTNHFFDRQANISLKRIPSSEATQKFNCNVVWKQINDTTFTYVEEKNKISSSYKTITIQSPIDLYLNGGRNALFMGGKSRIAFPITLPPNTVEWYYTFAATRNPDEVQSTKQNMKLYSDLASLLDASGFMSFGINALSQPPGSDYSDVYIMQPEFLQAFLNKDETWKYIADASRENLKSGVVKVDNCCREGKYIIGLKNPDSSYGVNVMIEVVAIVEESVYETNKIQVPLSVTTKKVPVFGN